MSVETLLIVLPICSFIIVAAGYTIYVKLSERKSHLEKVKILREERIERQNQLNSLLEKRKRRSQALRKKQP